MTVRTEWMVAWRYLAARRQEGFVSAIGWISLAGITLGVASLIIVISVMNGFRGNIMTRILGLDGHIVLDGGPGQAGFVPTGRMRAALDAVPGIAAVRPLIEGQVLVTRGRHSTGAVLRGVDPADLPGMARLYGGLVAGDAAAFADGAWIGARMAAALGVSVGDPVRILAPRGRAADVTTAPKSRAITVTGLFNVDLYAFDTGYIYLPLPVARDLLGAGDGVTRIDLRLADGADLDTVRHSLEPLIQGEARLRDWRDLNATLFDALRIERVVMALILASIVLVAAFNIVTGLVMLVRDKTKAVGIMRSMGASRGMVMRIFVLAGAAVGVAGTLVGAGLGLAVALNMEAVTGGMAGLAGGRHGPEVAFLSNLPSEVRPMEVVSIVGFSLAVAVLAALYPGWRAARLDPVAALRRG